MYVRSDILSSVNCEIGRAVQSCISWIGSRTQESMQVLSYGTVKMYGDRRGKLTVLHGNLVIRLLCYSTVHIRVPIVQSKAIHVRILYRATTVRSVDCQGPGTRAYFPENQLAADILSQHWLTTVPLVTLKVHLMGGEDSWRRCSVARTAVGVVPRRV